MKKSREINQESNLGGAALGARVGLAEGVAVDGLHVEGAALIHSVVRIT